MNLAVVEFKSIKKYLMSSVESLNLDFLKNKFPKCRSKTSSFPPAIHLHTALESDHTSDQLVCTGLGDTIST